MFDNLPTPKTAVIAIGGNSLIEDKQHATTQHQWDAVRKTAEHVAQLIKSGWQVVITHGNGPQVGFILRRNELAAHEVHQTPLDLIGADTQGAIGYMLQQTLDNALRAEGVNKSVITLITQTLVDPHDPAFDRPSKPIGSFLTDDQAQQFESEGWNIMEDAGRGWRRTVPSPKPLEIVELGAIRSMVRRGYVMITCGGGGIPVYRNDRGELRSLNAVIDKDLASSLLAAKLGADLFIISTGVEKVALNFNTPLQQNLDRMSLVQALEYMAAGEFAEGSMKPKMQAVINFLQMGGPQALITNPKNLSKAIAGETGTWITPI